MSADPYWFWLTFPGGVVLGMIVLSPFAIGYGIYSWIKHEREEAVKAKQFAEFKERIRKNNAERDKALPRKIRRKVWWR